ncbi:MAG TPA: hypothetical protein PL131_04105 [Methylotenera sp.]|nr:hypothetical protein [Methylotenera sp.]HPH05036.1 hypothetical protein [Methylotenera sp.]HPN00298.1 hypothetical protein [Methylotenera sp.]
MKIPTLVKSLMITIISAIVGMSIFYILALGLLYFFRYIFPSNEAEAAPPLWIGLVFIAMLLGMGFSAVYAGFWGYSRYSQSLTHRSSEKH